MKKAAKPRPIAYPGAPFVEEFINRFGTGDPELMLYASSCYRQRGSASIPSWEDYCYLPVNVAVGYCQQHGLDAQIASFNARLLAAAQAFVASHLIVQMEARELRAAWREPCTGAIPFDDLMNVPTFGYYVDLTPIEDEAHGAGVFVYWEDRFGHALTRGPTLHLIRGFRLPKLINGHRFAPCPLEIPLVPGKTVRECMDKFLDNGLLNGVVAESILVKEALEGLGLAIEDASRLVSLVSLVNRRLAYEEELPKYFEPVKFSAGGVVIRKCATLRI